MPGIFFWVGVRPTHSLVGRPKIGENRPRPEGGPDIMVGLTLVGRKPSTTILGITQGTCRKVSMYEVCREYFFG